MANLGNVWHLPTNPEPRGHSGMRDPVFPTTPVGSVTLVTGNQFQGNGGIPGNQLQDGSAVLFRRSTDLNWTARPLLFAAAIGNNKYYSGQIPAQTFSPGTVVQYYFRIPYSDRDTTFVQLNPADRMISTTTGDEAAAQADPFTFTVETPKERGQWSDLFTLPNVGIHANLLPNGLVLMWGRRDSPDQSLDVDPPTPIHKDGPNAAPARSTPFLFDPETRSTTPTVMPTMGDRAATLANLFCAGHALLPDGRLLVAGGHFADGAGLPLTTVYDPAANSWTPSATMTNGRWYPTLSTLTTGGVLILSGHFRDGDNKSVPNITPEVWEGGALRELPQHPEDGLDLYPRMHVASSGHVVTTGTLAQTWSLDTATGIWTMVPTHRRNAQRDYAPSVLYDIDKVIYIGGGNAPTANGEVLDMSQPAPQWHDASAMAFPRRQHNATILADGTVLVTGGTRSGGAQAPQDFNNLDLGQPIHVAEVWDPSSDTWTQLAAEQIDRCYHSTAVLLPDGRVLSAGGGEFFPIETVKEENDPADTHRDAQIFSPPYLFKGPGPVISAAPGTVQYRDTFHVQTGQAADVQKVNWLRLSSVTHSFNTGQRFITLDFKLAGDGLDITAPSGPEVCPPGHYMMFLLDAAKVPSVAKIVQVTGAPAAAAPAPGAAPASEAAPQDVFARRGAVLAAARGTKVVVGLTGTCPYGIGACWGGANEALRRLEDVDLVDPIPNGEVSTATVFLADRRLPPLDRWAQQFKSIVNDSYVLRGVEVTLTGTLAVADGQPVLEGEGEQPTVGLVALNPADKVQIDRATRTALPAAPDELTAFGVLADEAVNRPGREITVTGPLSQRDGSYTVQVRAVAG